MALEMCLLQFSAPLLILWDRRLYEAQAYVRLYVFSRSRGKFQSKEATADEEQQ